MSPSDFLEPIIAKANSAIQAEPGDYELDGLLHCGKCHTAKQVMFELNGKVFKPRCLCQCKADAIKAEEAAQEQREHDERIARMRRTAFSERMMENWTFANDDGTDTKTGMVMRNYVLNFAGFKADGKGLLLYGRVGTGKTYAACEVANALIDKGIPCIVTNFARITNTIQGMYEGKQAYLDDLSNYPLLVIDDLGAERRSEYMQEMVFNIIDSRYRSGLPMIITTNLPIEAIKNPANDSYARIYDRIIERCFPVCVDGKSRRRAAVRADYHEMKGLLGL